MAANTSQRPVTRRLRPQHNCATGLTNPRMEVLGFLQPRPSGGVGFFGHDPSPPPHGTTPPNRHMRSDCLFCLQLISTVAVRASNQFKSNQRLGVVTPATSSRELRRRIEHGRSSGRTGWADYWTKHHPAKHHQNVRREFITPHLLVEMLRLQHKQNKVAATTA